MSTFAFLSILHAPLASALIIVLFLVMNSPRLVLLPEDFDF